MLIIAVDICRKISIHAPHEGERPRGAYHGLYIELFQSTLPTRGSDTLSRPQGAGKNHISIHAPHEGERHYYFNAIFFF